ncbi:MAG: hypothetical protein U9O53_04510 [archaeon]|nr:hypothetical protein [archaeon]
MFNPFKKIRDITYNAFSRLDSIAEKPIKFIMPNYEERQDKILEKYLNQLLDNESLSTFDKFKVNFHSATVKSFYMLTDTIGGYFSIMTLNPLYIIAGDVIAGLNQYMRRDRLGNIVSSMSDFEIGRMRSMLDLGDMNSVKGVLHEYYW